MRAVKRVRNYLVVGAVACSVGVIAYQLLLDDEAKDSLKKLSRTLATSYRQVASIVRDRAGTYMDAESVRQNRQDIRDAWDELGI